MKKFHPLPHQNILNENAPSIFAIWLMYGSGRRHPENVERKIVQYESSTIRYVRYVYLILILARSLFFYKKNLEHVLNGILMI